MKMKVYYEKSCGSYVIANNEEEVKSVLFDLYIVKDHEFKISECNMFDNGHYVGIIQYTKDYGFGDVVDKFKEFSDSNSFDEFKVCKSTHGYKIWKCFYDILTDYELKPRDKIDEPFEIYNDED
jgi:hypothetical protein